MTGTNSPRVQERLPLKPMRMLTYNAPLPSPPPNPAFHPKSQASLAAT